MNPPFFSLRLNELKDNVLPENTVILRPQRVPASTEAHKTRIKSIDFGHLDKFFLAAAVKGPQNGYSMRGFKCPEVGLDRGTANLQRSCGPRDLQQTSALLHDIFKQRIELVRFSKSEEPLDIAGKERVHPFTVETMLLDFGEQRLGQAAMIESLLDSRVSKSGHLVPEDWRQMDDPFAARQGVLELAARRQRGRARGQDLEFRKNICANFQEPARVAELVDLIKDHDLSVAIAIEQLRVRGHLACHRKVTINIQNAVFAKAFSQGGFS